MKAVVHGVGIDIASCERFAAISQRHGARFLARWFTPAELSHRGPSGASMRGIAEVFAAKEAVWKCLGVAHWDGRVPWRDIAIVPTGAGSLTAVLSGAVAAAAREDLRIEIEVFSSPRLATAIATAFRPALTSAG